MSTLQEIAGKSKEEEKPDFEIIIRDKVTETLIGGKIKNVTLFLRSYASLLVCHYCRTLMDQNQMKLPFGWSDLRLAFLGMKVPKVLAVDDAGADAPDAVDLGKVCNTIDSISCLLRSSTCRREALALLWPSCVCDIEGLIICKSMVRFRLL